MVSDYASSVPILQVVLSSDMNQLFIIERAPFDRVVLEDNQLEIPTMYSSRPFFQFAAI